MSEPRITNGIDSRTGTYAPLFYINGMEFKWQMPDGSYWTSELPGYNSVCNPGRDYQEKTEQLVKSTRNAKGEVVSQTINRRLVKFENLYWPYLSAVSVQWLRKQIRQFDCDLSYWDDERGMVIHRKFYWGDFEATPCEWEVIWVSGRPYKKPIWYKDVKCNLIDKGLT